MHVRRGEPRIVSQKTQVLVLSLSLTPAWTSGKLGNLSALVSTTIKMGPIILVYYLTGKRMLVNKPLQGALKIKKVPGC